MKKTCEHCGSPLDEITGLCPNCDGDALVPMEQTENVEEATKKGIVAVLAVSLAIILVISAVVFAAARGWLGGNKKVNAEMKATYTAYLNNHIVPSYGLYNLNSPETAPLGLVSAVMTDVNKDKSEEFIVVYTGKSSGNIEYRIACYEYNPQNLAQGKQEEAEAGAGVELNAAVAAVSEADFTDETYEVQHPENETVIYLAEAKEKGYVIAEHLSLDEGNSYACRAYTIEGGKFVEADKLLAENLNDEKADEITAFFKKLGLKKSGCLAYNEEKARYALSPSKEKNLIFSYAYSLEGEKEETPAAAYEAVDYTDFKSLLNKENLEKFNALLPAAPAETGEEAPADASVYFGNVVTNGKKVYFWKYNGESFSSERAENGAYSFRTYADNQLIRRDVDGGETVLLDTNGAGALALAGDRIFYQKVSDGGNYFTVYSCALDGSDKEYHAEGQLAGVVQNGAYVVVKPNGSDFRTIYSVKTETLEKISTVYNARFVACSNDKIFYQAEQVDESDARRGKTTLSSVNANGSKNKNLYITEPDLYDEDTDIWRFSEALIEEPYLQDDDIYYVCASYSRSEFQTGRLVRVKLDGSEGEILAELGEDTGTAYTIDANGAFVSADGKTSMTGYTLENGSVLKYNQSENKLTTLVSPSDYASFSSAFSGGNSAENLLSLSYLEETDGKLYFMFTVGDDADNIDGVNTYRFASLALFEKNLSSGETNMIYSVSA